MLCENNKQSITVILFPFLILLILLYSFSSFSRSVFNGVGITTLDDNKDSPLIFYPSNIKNTVSYIGGYEIDASKSFELPKGKNKYPIIIVSHGTASSKLANHNLVTELVKYGFIVVTFNHAHDNYMDQSFIENNQRFYSRVEDVSVLIDQLSESLWQNHIAFNQIHFLGFSAGGSTGLFLSGGQFDVNSFNDYCYLYEEQEVCLTKNNIFLLYPI